MAKKFGVALEAMFDVNGLTNIIAEQLLQLGEENAKLRQALEEIDAVAYKKKVGAAKEMQAIARKALYL